MNARILSGRIAAPTGAVTFNVVAPRVTHAWFGAAKLNGSAKATLGVSTRPAGVDDLRAAQGANAVYCRGTSANCTVVTP